MNSSLFVNGVEIYKLKAKEFEINVSPLCLDNVSKHLSADNMKKTGLYWYAYDFPVDYHTINAGDILDIHKDLMKKHDINKILD